MNCFVQNRVHQKKGSQVEEDWWLDSKDVRIWLNLFVWCYFVSLLIDYILYLVACVLCGWHGRAEVWCWCWHSVPNKLYWSRDWHCSQNNAELLWKICGLRLFIICYFSIWASIILCMLIAYVCSLFCYCWIDLRPNTLEGDFRKLRTSNTSCRLSCPMLILLVVKLAVKQLKNHEV